MKTLIGSLILLTASLKAAPLVTIPVANLSGFVGQSFIWDARVTGDATNYVTFTSSFPLVESNPALGSYFDMLGIVGGPSDFVLLPGQTWDTQLASYLTDPGALPGSVNTITVRVLWEEYSDDPNFCGTCFLGSGFSDHVVSVTVGAVPEPGTATLFVLAGAGLAAIRLRRRR